MEHHAYLLVGERDEAEAHLSELLRASGIEPVGNPDVFIFAQNVFAVDDARALAERAIEKAFGERKVFVIYSEKFTPEAQNALLKTFEDPVPNTHFILTAREPSILLPTLLSRLHTVRVGGEFEEASDAKRFLKKTPKQRIDWAKRFADEREERGAGALAEFLDSLLMILRSEGASPEIMRRVLRVREFARDTAANWRLILEHLALVLP